ncbi:NAD-dependent epimerase/dehydratase family protein, partial [Xanthomonas citri pv. citri]
LRSVDYQLDDDADAIIHLAGKAHDTKNTSEESDYYQINTELTKVLFDKFLQSDIKDFIFFSSVKAAADTVEGVLTEEVEPNPKTPYGDSKIKAEQYLLSQELPSGKRVIIIRPCMIHGKGNKGNLNLLYKVVR